MGVVIKIGIVGCFIEDNFSFILKCRGKVFNILMIIKLNELF